LKKSRKDKGGNKKRRRWHDKSAQKEKKRGTVKAVREKQKEKAGNLRQRSDVGKKGDKKLFATPYHGQKRRTKAKNILSKSILT